MCVRTSRFSAVATAAIEQENAGSASALFNMMRNLGDTIGIAALQTLLTKREQDHSHVLSQQVTMFEQALRTRLDQLTQYFMSHGVILLISIVDDDESVRESLPDLLKQFGFAVEAFSSAEEFLASDHIGTDPLPDSRYGYAGNVRTESPTRAQVAPAGHSDRVHYGARR
jgi:hypothetical protein